MKLDRFTLGKMEMGLLQPSMGLEKQSLHLLRGFYKLRASLDF